MYKMLVRNIVGHVLLEFKPNPFCVCINLQTYIHTVLGHEDECEMDARTIWQYNYLQYSVWPMTGHEGVLRLKCCDITLILSFYDTKELAR